MDPQRFDTLAKRLGTSISRRGALRAGAGAALGAVALGKLSPARAQDPDTTLKDRFISIRTYPYTGPIPEARDGLKDLVSLMEQQPGFISIDFVGGDTSIYVVATFLDKSSAVAAANAEDAWIADNAEAILAGKPEIKSGTVFLRSELQTGCGCITGTQDPCNSDRLTCCPTTDRLGGPGICMVNATTCPAMEASPTATAAPPPPTEEPACTWEGCACNGGVQNTCDEGLSCCGADIPGGQGVCAYDCGGGGCTWEGCACTGGVEGGCDPGLECCGADIPGGTGTCASDCGAGGCTWEGCACTAGTQGACDDGLTCCGADIPGGAGTCAYDCGGGACTGEGCACVSGTEGACDAGLVCCGAAEPGGSGTCQIACG
ncbi:MAG: hypothetical protein IT339_06425 [Thermomicrobiales bacterium]|nr:hypothetical protein [Thermomicrobiales bacterium]